MLAKHCFVLVMLAAALAVATVASADDSQGTKIALGEGKVSLVAPASWEPKEPSTRIVDYEFRVPPVEGDKREARVTVMGAGGSVEQNIARWMQQFTQPDGQATSARTKQEKKTVNGQTVHIVDIRGDYQNPFRPADNGANFRLLGAIVVTEKLGQYFIKLYGPEKTIAANEEAFNKLVNSLSVK